MDVRWHHQCVLLGPEQKVNEIYENHAQLYVINREFRTISHVFCELNPYIRMANLPYRYSISSPPEGPKGQPPLSHWVTQRKSARWASSEPTPLSPDTPLEGHWM